MNPRPFVALTLLFALSARAQVPLPVPIKETPEPLIVDKERDSQVVQTTTTDESGQPVTHSFVQVQTGLNYRDEAGRWQSSRPEFHLTALGAVAPYAPQTVVLATNINSSTAVTVVTPEGFLIQSGPLAISYFDPISGTNIVLATIQDSAPEKLADDQIVYRKCFDTLDAAIRYTVTTAGLEQDLLLFEAPPDPELLGLSPLTRIELISEFASGTPMPKVTRRVMESESDPAVREMMAEPDFTDDWLDFGEMKIGPGRSFALGDASTLPGSAPVAKTFQVVDSRAVLIEAVPIQRLAPLLKPLVQAKVSSFTNAVLNAQATRKLPTKRPTGMASVDFQELRAAKPLMAKATIKPPAAVVDYSLLTSSTNMVFKGDSTYYVSGNVTLSSTTTFEGGAVIKSTNGVSVTATGPITWLASPFRPVVFSSKDDNSIGETITGSSGSPTGPNYANPALQVNTANVQLSNLRVAYAQAGIFFYDTSAGNSNSITHAQFVHCGQAIKVNGYGTTFQNFAARNLLINDCSTAFYGYSFSGDIEHLTLDQGGQVAYDFNGTNYGTTSSLSITNSLLVSLTNGWGNITTATNAVYNPSSAAGVFQSVIGGSHYLADGTYRNIGTATVNAGLLTDLRKATTYAPVVLTNSFTANTTLWPSAARDQDSLDIGYHYWPVDFIWTSLAVNSGVTLTLTNGVSVASYGPKLLTLSGTGQIVSEGKPQNLNRLVTFHTVQEQPQAWITNTASMTLINGVNVNLRFSDVSFMAAAQNGRYLTPGSYFNGTITVQDSQLRGVYSYFWTYSGSGASNPNYVFKNSILERCKLDWTAGYTITPFDPYYLYITFQNNLFTRSTVTLGHYGSYYGAWNIYDNLFDNCTMSLTEYDPYNQSGAGGPLTTADYNGYASTSNPFSSGGTHNKTGLTANYLSGPLGNYYYPTNGATNTLTALINAGSKSNAALVGLYHYTTTTDQVKEANTQLDIGFHVVAVDANGKPIDTNGNGIADYWEDRNGNGVVDAGEIPFGVTIENPANGAVIY